MGGNYFSGFATGFGYGFASGALLGPIPPEAWASPAMAHLLALLSAAGLTTAIRELKNGAPDLVALDATFSLAPHLLTISQQIRVLTGSAERNSLMSKSFWPDAGEGMLYAPSGDSQSTEARLGLSVRCSKQGKTVLGHYPRYVELAEQLEARTFKVPSEVWNRMTPAQRWAANQRFLDRMIARGDEVILATPVERVKANSFFERELKYLAQQGFRLNADGTHLTRP